jgi:hypothetical protein
VLSDESEDRRTVLWRNARRADATIVDVDFDVDCQPYALYVVEVEPPGRPPFRTEVGSPLFGSFDYPSSGTVPIMYDDRRDRVKLDASRLPKAGRAHSDRSRPLP